MVFAQPSWLWALLLLPLAVAAEAWATRRDRARTALLVARPLWPKVVRAPGAGWRHPRLVLLLLGGAGMVVALARPQWGIVREKVEREGVDVVLLLDTSGSMATEDVPPNRFQLARTALMNLVQRLDGDRFALVAFEGDAYPLVPLTLDADAISLFLETLEPGAVPRPGTSLGAGLAKGLEAFADKTRQNKVMVLVSDGEDLEGQVDEAVRQAKEAGVVVHTVAVGTEAGQPVPDFDRTGARTGYKKDDAGAVVVSRVHTETLSAIARGTGGRMFVLTAADLSLAPLASALEGLEQKTLAREYSYRKKERFQLPLGLGLLALVLALLLPLPERRSRAQWAGKAAAALLLLAGAPAAAQSRVGDELLLRPTRLTAQGQKQYADGNDPKAVEAFGRAAALRPGDRRARFNLADALYKSGKLDEAKAIYEQLGADARSDLAAPSRYNLGNTLFQKQDYAGAVRSYRDALRLAPSDPDTRRNLELALRALQQQEQQQKQDPKNQDDKQKQDQKQQPKGGQKQSPQQPGQGNQSPRGGEGQKQERPKTEEEKEKERYEKEAGMPKERAMQLLNALQQNEKNEQKKLQAARQKDRPRSKDW